MFFKNKNEKILSEVINSNYAVIYFKPDGTIIKANEVFLKTMGYSLEEIVGKHHSIFCEEKFAKTQEYKDGWDAVRAGETVTAEFQRVKKDGNLIFLRASYMPIIENGKVVEVVKLAQDITKNRLKNLFFIGQVKAINKSNAVIEFDMNGNILNANDNFLNTLGYKKDDIVGKHHSIFCEENYKNSNEYKEFWKKLNRGEFDSGEYLRIAKNGNHVWIQASYNPILDMNGKAFRVVKYATDITNKKNTMFEVEKEIKEFSNSLNTLLTTSINMLKDAKFSNENSQNATSSSQNINSLIQDLSNKIDEMQQAIVDISSKTSKNEQIAQEATVQSKQTATAMVKLNEESQKIGETVNIISQIAFQTNILSLNAAVEAATAGEAGKGFAVVAQEVRNLASRSAEAAKEIKDIVENATKKANEGKDIANEMIEGYKGLNDSINQTINLISDIEMSSKEQLLGIEQINDAVNSLDQQTQQNAIVANQTHDIAVTTDEIAKLVVENANAKEFEGKNNVKAKETKNFNTNTSNIVVKNKPIKIQKISTKSKIIEDNNSDDEWESF